MAHIHCLTHDEILKLKAVVLYIVNKCSEIDYFHLFKIIYFADRMHYATYGRRIIQDTFCALPKGPVPSQLYDAIKDAIGKQPLENDSNLKLISNSLTSSDETYPFILNATEQPDMDELSKSDINMLDKSIFEYKDIEMQELSDKSHDFAWESAVKISPNSPMDPILIAKAGGASEGTIAFIRENEYIDKILN
jgi:uncharacterized phage-associated protein